MISFSRASTEAPLIEYEMQKMEQVMRNSRVFRSLGIQEAANILKQSRPMATNATREDSGSLYQPKPVKTLNKEYLIRYLDDNPTFMLNMQYMMTTQHLC